MEATGNWRESKRKDEGSRWIGERRREKRKGKEKKGKLKGM